MKQLRKKGFVHWLIVLLLTGIGIYLERALDEKEAWVETRYKIYQWQQEHLSNPKTHAEWLAVVQIGDEEYWKGELDGRTPIKRDYLGRLLRTLNTGEPLAIALDFDFRSPMPDGSLIDNHLYREETAELVRAIQDVSRLRKIVLPVTLGGTEEYYVAPDIFSGVPFDEQRVLRGYIALPFDLRSVPLRQELKGGKFADSLVTAMVRTRDPRLVREDELVFPFGSYLKREAFGQCTPKGCFAGDVLARANDATWLKQQFQGRIVIIGGAWSQFAYGWGSTVDTYPSPIGPTVGAFIHANLAESLIDQSRVYTHVGESMSTTLEVIVVLMMAVLFALDMNGWVKILTVIVGCLLLFLCSYFMLQNFGIYFDFWIPLVLVAGHAAADQVREWRQLANKYEALHKAGHIVAVLLLCLIVSGPHLKGQTASKKKPHKPQIDTNRPGGARSAGGAFSTPPHRIAMLTFRVRPGAPVNFGSCNPSELLPSLSKALAKLLTEDTGLEVIDAGEAEKKLAAGGLRNLDFENGNMIGEAGKLLQVDGLVAGEILQMQETPGAPPTVKTKFAALAVDTRNGTIVDNGNAAGGSPLAATETRVKLPCGDVMNRATNQGLEALEHDLIDALFAVGRVESAAGVVVAVKDDQAYFSISDPSAVKGGIHLHVYRPAKSGEGELIGELVITRIGKQYASGRYQGSPAIQTGDVLKEH